MSKKPKFRPEITRVKLNPEQAVLACNCYDTGANYYMDKAVDTEYFAWHHTGASTYCNKPGSKEKVDDHRDPGRSHCYTVYPHSPQS